MHLTFSPVRNDSVLTLHRAGDILTVNGNANDFGPLPEGAVLPEGATGCPWIIGEVTRISGVLHLTLILPHGATAPHETRFAAPITVTTDGPVALPPHDGEPA